MRTQIPIRSLVATAMILGSLAAMAVPSPEDAAAGTKPAPGTASKKPSPASTGAPADKKPAAASTAASAPAVPAKSYPGLETDDQKTLYALGIVISQNLAQFALTPAELETVKMGLTDGMFAKEMKVELPVYGPKIQTFVEGRSSRNAAAEKKAGEEYLAKMAKEPGAKGTSSGIIMFEIKPGTGASPGKTDKVKVNYTGTLIDGTVFDSSAKKGEPAEFGLDQVVPCWTESLQLMKVGGKSKFICPSSVAWGDHGSPPKIKGGAVVIFELELLDIVK